jgi:uncharacterized membrane protein
LGSDSVHEMERIVSRVLRAGVVISSALVVAGLALLSLTGNTSCPNGVVNLRWIILGDPFLAPSHVLFLGFMVLISTPVLRIIASILVYLKTRDVSFVTITVTVLLILAMSFTLGIG